MRMHAEAIGLPRFERAPSLNDHEDFLQALTDLVIESLQDEG
jgi:protoheme ferro-lyase